MMCYRTAYIHGLGFCTGDFVIIMDADFSHHVCVISILSSKNFTQSIAKIYPTIYSVRHIRTICAASSIN